MTKRIEWKCAGCGVVSPGRKRACDCWTSVLYRKTENDDLVHEIKIEPPTQAENDLAYLEQADAHADEGPLGEEAARSILKIALRNTRAFVKIERR